ncbi:MAG: glucose-6-phosphate isomerase [Nitrospirota bacterium]
MDQRSLWERYKKYLCQCPSIGLTLDISRMNFADDFFARMEPEIQKAFKAMDALETGAIANPDEDRMVGHYWLRTPSLAPSPEIRCEIEDTGKVILQFAHDVHSGKIKPQKARRFDTILCIGIGGSALGPQFVTDALASTEDRMKVYFLDNTDPDGFDRMLSGIGSSLSKTLTIVISKSGGTAETRNGMLEVMQAYRKSGLSFERHAVAITGVGSNLDNLAISGNWIARFPMWDWVGGRTSIASAVGLLPMALQGIDITDFIGGAADCDMLTRNRSTGANPAAVLALMWHHATSGRGQKDMVVLPYKDRLQLFSKYLQQLIMESLGKEKDLAGTVVNQGISVYGNKGTTDQHAYVQQLRDGVKNFFVSFIEVLNDRDGRSPEVDPGVTSGDYLSSFLQGTRNALFENGRASLTITVEKLDARTVGAIIALFERAVGLYAVLVNINAYHQPGVEAGKKMAGAIIELQREIMGYLHKNHGRTFTAEELAQAIGVVEKAETVFKILEHASANRDHRIKKTAHANAFLSHYGMAR